MNRKYTLLLLSFFFLTPIYAQTWDEIKSNTQTYIYGEGSGYTVEEADQGAIRDLISKISLVVSNDFSITEDEISQNGTLDSKTYTNSKLQTYSSATLTNTERVVIDSSPDEFLIGRYMKRSEIERIFEGRILTIKEYVRLGLVAEAKLKIDDALRNYYWAFALLKSVQHPAEVSYTNEYDGKTLQLLTWLPERINSVLSNISVAVARYDDANVDLKFTCEGKPVSSLDFTYFDGRNWSNISSVKDGLGTMEFSKGMIPENIQINYEYAYRSQAHINPEMKAVLAVVKGQAIRKSRTNIRLSNFLETRTRSLDDVQAQALLASQAQEITNAQSFESTLKIPFQIDTAYYLSSLNTILKSISKRNYSGIDSYFTPEGRDMFNKIINYGNARILNADNVEIYPHREYIVVRGVQASFSFKQGVRKNFVEDIVFTFNEEKKIDCVAFGLGEDAKKDIIGKEVWPLEARRALMEFLENYKTAYALKRLDYLKTIFDDNAVIIVGHVAKVMKEVPSGDGKISYVPDTRITRTQITKDQYMKNLESSFKSNEFINIRFANNDVRKAQQGEEYGIQIKQDYYSTNYGDEGYLYIQVNIDNPEEPIIKVRAWQPKPDPEIGIYGIGNW